jgi:hypothetical protein
MATITEYVKAHGITVDVVKDNGRQIDETGWEHLAFNVRLGYAGRTLTVPWRQGMGITTHPVHMADSILDSLISDACAWQQAEDFEDFASEFGYETEDPEDARRVRRIWQTIERLSPRVVALVGGQEEFDVLAYETDRL